MNGSYFNFEKLRLVAEANPGLVVGILGACLLALIGVIYWISSEKKPSASLPPVSEEKETTREVPLPSEPVSLLKKLKEGLSKTHSHFKHRLDSLLSEGPLNQATLDEIEELLYTADLGPQVVSALIERLTAASMASEDLTPELARDILKEELIQVFQRVPSPVSEGEWKEHPHVILMIGVNGAGKTTTIGKLATKFIKDGKRVLLAAGDTFRAAAVEQLEVWAERSGAEFVKLEEGADPASVAFEAMTLGKSKGVDLVLIDTAGRLHTKSNLMEELKKVKRVIQKADPSAPHEVLLVIDAITGQNALKQAQEFHEALGITGLVLTKLDGSAKGGFAVSVTQNLGIPIQYIGVGEKVDDLREFEPKTFVEALIG